MLPSEDDWSTRHAVRATARRTAALVNALTASPDAPDTADTPGSPGNGGLPQADVVAGVLRAYGERGPLDLGADDLAGLRTAALALREVFAAGDADLAASRLNRLLRQCSGPLRLTSHGGTTPWHPHLDSADDAPWGEWLLASSCLALSVLVWDRQRPPGGLCASPSCGNVFLTLGSGPVRRYCSRRCATRERVAAHRRSRT